MKKIYFALGVVATLCAAIGLSACKEEIPVETLKYYLSDDGTNYRVYGTENDTVEALEIPSEHEGLPVTKIGGWAFHDWTMLKSITIPKSVTSINLSAFNTTIESVYYDGTADDWAMIEFEGRSANPLWFGADFHLRDEASEMGYSLVEDISLDCEYVGDFAFYGSSLKRVAFGDNVKIIGESAFEKSSLESITIPDTITDIGYSAFNHCTFLESIALPNHLLEIETYQTVFPKKYELEALTALYYDGTADEWAVNASQVYTDLLVCANNLYLKDGDGYSLAEDITLETEYINTNAFNSCTSLRSVTLSNTKLFGNGAFSSCKSLTAVYYNGALNDWVNLAFENEYANPLMYAKNLYVKDNASETGYTLVTSLPSEGITSIATYALCGCSFTSLTIPESITSLGESAFSYCDSLESVTIPDTFTRIENYLFSHCYSLTSVTIPQSVTVIGEYAFYFCTALESITIPDNVTSIDNNAFAHCHSLKSISIPDSVLTLGDEIFSCCYRLESVTIPDGLTNWGDGIFKSCSALKKIVLPDGLTKIPYRTFYDCDSLMNVTIPSSVTTIGISAFTSCDSLFTITLPDSVTTIERGAFSYSGVANLTIPDSVTTIERGAFRSCTNLKQAVFENADGWYYVDDEEVHALESENLGNPASAVHCIWEHCEYAWFREN